MAVEFCEVAYDSPLYVQSKQLRQDVLRTPIGLVLDQKDVADEEEQCHVAGVEDGKVVAVTIMKMLTPQRVKIRQVAVADNQQGRGIGRELMAFTEALAYNKGFCEAEMSARLTALGFYEKLGYTAVGEPFSEVGLPTIKMVKTL